MARVGVIVLVNEVVQLTVLVPILLLFYVVLECFKLLRAEQADVLVFEDFVPELKDLSFLYLAIELPVDAEERILKAGLLRHCILRADQKLHYLI